MTSTFEKLRMVLATVVTVVCTLVAGPAPAAAQQEAKEAFQQGQEAYNRGDFAGAIALWQRSFELSQKVSLFYNMGLAYERMGKLEEAVSALERFVSSVPPDDPYLDRGRARLALIRERLAQTGVLLTCNQEGATILIDDRDIGRTPRPDRISLAPGSHRVIVRKAGFADFRSDVVLSGGQELKLEATLVPAGSAAGGVPEAAPLPAPAPAQRADDGAGSGRSLLGPLLAGGGALVAITGVVVGSIALGKATDAQSQDDADSARTLALVADLSMVVGVATAAVGTYLWLFGGREPAQEPRASVAVAPHPGGALVSARMRF